MSSSSISLSEYENESSNVSATKTVSNRSNQSESVLYIPNIIHRNQSQEQSIPHPYTALKTEVMTQHEQHYSTTTQEPAFLNAEPSFPYTRFSSYNPLIGQDNTILKPDADQQQAITPPDNTDSYAASTSSCDVTPSYNSTIPPMNEYNSIPSSSQVEPDLESHSYVYTSYWHPGEFSLLLDAAQCAFACVGAQFDVYDEVPVVENMTV